MPICAAPNATNVHASKALTLIYSMFLFLDLNVNFLVSLSNSRGSGAKLVLSNKFLHSFVILPLGTAITILLINCRLLYCDQRKN